MTPTRGGGEGMGAAGGSVQTKTHPAGLGLIGFCGVSYRGVGFNRFIGVCGIWHRGGGFNMCIGVSYKTYTHIHTHIHIDR
jgi:hypothetical protein